MARRGLPGTVRMRHDEHYVDALTTATGGAAVGRMVPIDLIDPNPNQPRQVMGDLSELMASIAEKGVIEPLVVRPTVRLYREQIFSPKTFVWRVVLPEAVLIDRLHLALVDALPGYYFSIHELRLYAE